MFVMNIPMVAKQSHRNPRKTNWDTFRSLLNRKINIAPAPINSIRELECRVNSLTNNIISSFEASCPRSYAKKCRPPWWNEKLSLLRRNARRAFNESYRTKVWTPYKDALRVYKKALRESKKLSWNSHCQQIESIKESARLAKLLANGQSCPSLINKVDGNPVKSLTESLSLLVDTHFPGSSGDPPKVLPYRSANSGETIQSVVSSRRIKWAIDSFSPYKSPGPDGILPIMLQSLGDVAVNWLYAIFCSCFSLNHVPSGWRQVRVVFIPKA
ncbi:uncharacterized protein LOC119665301, partial [Teleopsis dalmanni]|uniref:uncharacterized protein LOC119665301 n=1 Tax=Teleopsis dalmanni TaxID=139649 RepID=UPI0018CC7C09